MKHLIYVLFIAMLVGCEMLSTDNDSNDNGNNEENPKLTLYQITEDIDAFESVFLAEDGNCLAIKKDTTFGYVAVFDSLKAYDEKALVVYIDSLGKVRRVFNDGKSLDIAYNSEGYINLWYRDSEGTSKIFNDIKYTPTKTVTKAGEVFDPMDIGSIALALLDMKDIKDAMAFNPLIGDGLKANIMADLLTTGPFSNTTTEILTGITSIAITAIVGTSSLPIAVLLAIIGTANAAISDWQNMVADSYFGTAHPVTGEAVQLTDKHFVVSYSIADVDSGNTDFKVGVIVAEGKIFEDAMFITKNWHSYKKSEIYTGNKGHIIINLGDLNPKKGDKLKYRIYLEPADDNGFKWDDKLLDYWRYGEVKEFVIDEPALKIESAIQTNATTDDGYRYTFDVDVNVRNDIPFELDDWGVAIYATSLDECTSEDQQYDIKSAKGNGNQTMSFSIDVNDIMMDTEQTPYIPIMNHFAVPYISFDGHTFGIYDNAVKINLTYDIQDIRITGISMSDPQHTGEVIFKQTFEITCDNLSDNYHLIVIKDSKNNFKNSIIKEGKVLIGTHLGNILPNDNEMYLTYDFSNNNISNSIDIEFKPEYNCSRKEYPTYDMTFIFIPCRLNATTNEYIIIEEPKIKETSFQAITPGYLFVGTINGWEIDKELEFNHSGNSVYEDPIFHITVSVPDPKHPDPIEFKIIPSTYDAWGYDIGRKFFKNIGCPHDEDCNCHYNSYNIILEGKVTYTVYINMLERTLTWY